MYVHCLWMFLDGPKMFSLNMLCGLLVPPGVGWDQILPCLNFINQDC